MNIETFHLERIQSLWEHRVEINLAESGVDPVSLADLRHMGLDLGALVEAPLAYIQTNGTPELRQAICESYPGSTLDQVEVTNGTSEANFHAAHVLLVPGDEVLFEVPNYMQVAGIARHLGCEVKTFRLRRHGDWEMDWDEFEAALSQRTKLVYVSHPNNPTGFVLQPDEMARLVAAVERCDAWLVADEVYRGTEHTGEMAPSFWGLSERVICTSGLSKAYGIPGLRIGWIVGPPDFIDACWTLHDYVTIAPSALSDLVARFAVKPRIRDRLLERGRSLMVANERVFRQWVGELDGLLRHTPPRAGAYAFVEYHADCDSQTLCEDIRQEHSVLLLPGVSMGMEHHVRFGLGGPADRFAEGLDRVKRHLSTLRK